MESAEEVWTYWRFIQSKYALFDIHYIHESKALPMRRYKDWAMLLDNMPLCQQEAFDLHRELNSLNHTLMNLLHVAD